MSMEAELLKAGEGMDAKWKEMEIAEKAYSTELWSLLVEKATDLIVSDAEEEAREIELLTKQWVRRLSDKESVMALHFDPERKDESGVKADAVADGCGFSPPLCVLSSCMHGRMWACIIARPRSGDAKLEERKAACLSKREDAAVARMKGVRSRRI